MPPQPLARIAAQRQAARLSNEIGPKDSARLEQLLPLIGEDGRINLGAALQALYPGKAHEAALTDFRQFRARLDHAAMESGLPLSLKSDSQTRTPPGARWCWFEGEDGAAQSARVIAAGETAAFAAQPFVNPQGMEELEQRDGKTVIRYFVSYAHADKDIKERLLKRLQPMLSNASGYVFEPWQDGEILPGEGWFDEIQRAIARCQFGFLLVSPEFLSRKFIRKHELPHFVADDPALPTKPCIPIALREIKLDGSFDLKGLAARQIFHDDNGYAFSQRTTDKQREAFVSALFDAIYKSTRKRFPATATPEEKPAAATWADHLRIPVERDYDPKRFVRTQGHGSSIDKLAQERPKTESERSDALQFLADWLANPQAQPYCALLGEYGMGKTTTCKALAHNLLEQQQVNPAAPLPIYLDLRLLGEKAKSEPALTEIIDSVLAKSWQTSQGKASLSAAEAIRLVQQQGALAIFDGLDEVLVHLTPAAGQRFTREIFAILPPELFRTGKTPPSERRGRLLVTCRTHYFRTLREQKTLLTAQDRDNIEAGDYRAFVLLPFNDAQIHDYFVHSLPGEDPERLLALIRAVHNLPEMAERPYTLSLIARHIPEIERWKLEGRNVTGVTLYRHMILSWLERDSGKHQLTPDHKQRLMERFAAALWRKGERTWNVADLEDWLLEFLAATPKIAAHYEGVSRELLKEDLRTATFLVREGEDRFRFAHTSLQEFFLAAYLCRALNEARPDDWALPRPSPETLDFLGQMLSEMAQPEAVLATLRTIRAAYRPQASELLLAYALHAQHKGYPAPTLAGMDLAGADLRGWEILGLLGQPPLNLSGATLRGANLENAKLRWLDLSEADFTDTNLTRAEIRDGAARRAKFAAADLTGTVFRDMALDGTDFGGARCYRSQFLRCGLEGVEGLAEASPAVLSALSPVSGAEEKDVQLRQQNGAPTMRLAFLDGHTAPVNACAWSPDSASLLSASEDKTLRLWDARSGECRLVLQGHEDWVNGCAWSPDGASLLSASRDKTLRLWSARNGECRMVLRGHEGTVNSCAWSPDGASLLSASADNTLRLWSARSGECRMVLRGHEGTVNSCAWSPDGATLLSASDDDTLRLWDASSGVCRLVLRGHEHGVSACAWSPDGASLLSASRDYTLRLWDTRSGECRLVLHGHKGAVSACAWSPDSVSLLSASEDKTLRLWDARNGECRLVLHGHEYGVFACAWSPDSVSLLSASEDKTLRLWDARSGECLPVLKGHEDWVSACAWSPDGASLLSASWDKTLRLWDARSGACRLVLQEHEGVNACAWSPDGLSLLSISGSGILRLWDARSGSCRPMLQEHENRVNACVWSPDSVSLLSASKDNTLRLWDARSGECRLVLQGHEREIAACAWSLDGASLLSASWDKTLRLWDARSGECRLVLQGHEREIAACAWSPDGASLLSASKDQTLRLWDARSGKSRLVLHGHKGAVSACAWSLDGASLLSASWDNTLRLWDARSGECRLVLQGHEGGVAACSYSPDSRFILSASHDGTLRRWDAASGKEIAAIHFAEDGWASLDWENNRILQVQGDAWRYLGWLAPDPQSDELIRLPAETFGPLPEFVEPLRA